MLILTSIVSQLVFYFLVAYAFTWVLHGAIPSLRIPYGNNLRSTGRVLYLIGIGGPLISALLTSALFLGVSGVWNLLMSATVWRVNPSWYLVAMFAVGAVYFVCICLNTLFGGRFPRPLFHRPSQGLFVIPAQLWVVVAEEFGWRGFALPRLHELIGWLGAAVILGVLWASWHLPMFFVRGSNQFGSSFKHYLIVVTLWTIFMAMLYSRTGGSVLICMIFHAAANIWAFTINFPEDASRFELPAYLVLAIVAIVLLPNVFS